jgi:hypothetical protein
MLGRQKSLWAFLAASAVLGITAGCTPDQGAAPDDKPGDTARNAAVNIDKQIEKVKSDPNIPAESKQKAIEGLERGKAAAAAAAASAAPPSGVSKP